MDPNQNQPGGDNPQQPAQTNPLDDWHARNQNQTPAYNNVDYWNPNPTQQTESPNPSQSPSTLPQSFSPPTPEVTQSPNTTSLGTQTSSQDSPQEYGPSAPSADPVMSSAFSEPSQPTSTAAASMTSTPEPQTPLANNSEVPISTQEASIPPAPDTPSKPAGSSNTLMIIMVVLVITLLGSTGLLAFQNYQLKQQVNGNNITDPSPTTDAEEPDPMASWKTYSNPAQGFEIKYPADWQENKPATGSPDLVYLNAPPLEGDLRYSVSVSTVNKLPNVPTQEEVINDLGFMYTTEAPSRSGALTYYIAKGNTYLSFLLQPYNEDTPNMNQEALKETFKSMLGTFKLISASPSPSPTSTTGCQNGFKEFKNANFSFCYPDDMKAATGNTASAVVLENDRETLRVVQNFQGGWGGSACLTIDAVKIADYPSKRLSWKSEKTDGSCDSSFTSFASMINEGVFKFPYPYMIELKSKSGNFAANSRYLTIEQSFKPAK